MWRRRNIKYNPIDAKISLNVKMWWVRAKVIRKESAELVIVIKMNILQKLFSEVEFGQRTMKTEADYGCGYVDEECKTKET